MQMKKTCIIKTAHLMKKRCIKKQMMKKKNCT